MKKTVQRTSKFKAFWGMLALVLVLGAGLFAGDLAFVSHAESAAKVTASSAKIRKSADSSSEVIGSAEKDKTISIKSQTKGADGYTWYEVYVDANTLGYIRSDLVSITDGSTPPSSSNTTTTTTTTATPAPAVNETPVDVTTVEPVSATVTGGQSVRVRSNASTTSQIVTTAENGTALTVTGQAAGTDGNTWYQVNFIANNTEVTGFIRSDYVALSGELQAPSTEQPAEGQPAEISLLTIPRLLPRTGIPSCREIPGTCWIWQGRSSTRSMTCLTPLTRSQRSMPNMIRIRKRSTVRRS